MLSPNLKNVTRVLSIFMPNPSMEFLLELIRLIGCVKGAKMNGVTCVKPNSFKELMIVGTYVGNCVEERRSVR